MPPHFVAGRAPFNKGGARRAGDYLRPRDPPRSVKSLRYKVGVSYFAIVAVTVGVAGLAAMSFLSLGDSVSTLFRTDFRVVVAAEGMIRELERQEFARAQVTAADTSQRAFRDPKAQYAAWYNEAIPLIGDEDGIAYLNAIDAAYNEYLTRTTEFFRLVGEGREAEAARSGSTAASLAVRVRDLNFRLLERSQMAVGDKAARTQEAAARARSLVLAVAAAAVGLSLLLAVRFARRIVGPIERLTRAVGEVGEGRMRSKVDVRSDDELATLGREFNKMTERLQAYDALNVQQLVAEKRKSESLVETMPSPVIVTDEDGRVLLLNGAAKDLLDVDAWQNLPLADVVRDGQLRGVLLGLAGRDGAGGDGAAVEAAADVVAVERHGDVHYYRARQRTVEAGTLRLRVALLEDVTHFKQLDQLKTDFIAAVSHELRTPLMSMGMAVDLMLEGASGTLTDPQRDLLDSVKDDQARLRRLVSGLLALARIESGTYEPTRATVVFADVVEEAVAPLRLPYREKGVALGIDVPAGLPALEGDAHHLGWVVSNLVGNALRYTSAGGRVEVGARGEGDALHLHVSDTGVGVPDEALETIFGAFVQLKDRNEATPGSLGLGLAMARRVVEAHGGRIWAENNAASELAGQGTTFHVLLPLHAREGIGTTPRRPASPGVVVGTGDAAADALAELAAGRGGNDAPDAAPEPPSAR